MNLLLSPQLTSFHSSFLKGVAGLPTLATFSLACNCCSPQACPFWTTQCRQELIHSRVCRVWMKFQQARLSGAWDPGPTAGWPEMGGDGLFLWTDCHSDRLVQPALSRKPLFYPRPGRKPCRSNIFGHYLSGGLWITGYFRNTVFLDLNVELEKHTIFFRNKFKLLTIWECLSIPFGF